MAARKPQERAVGEIVNTDESFEGLLPSIKEVAANPDTAILAQIRTLAAKIEDQGIALAEHRRVIENLIHPLMIEPEPEGNSERPKVVRRRSRDAMERAPERVRSGERPAAADDSLRVIEAAINDVIALRQIMNDLMQA